MIAAPNTARADGSILAISPGPATWRMQTGRSPEVHEHASSM
jgi:hypothetical protein